MRLNRHLLRMHAQARRVVLIVDEAQGSLARSARADPPADHLETETQKLLQIILIGQPELRTLLARQDLRQLAQRITGRYHLDPLSRDGDRRLCAPSPAGGGRHGPISSRAARCARPIE